MPLHALGVVGAIVAMGIVLVLKFVGKDASNKCRTLGASAALVVMAGYPGGVTVEGDLGQRWITG